MRLFYFLQLIFWFFKPPKRFGVRAASYARLRNAITKLRAAVIFLFAALMAGMVGYRIIEHTSWFDSYYMSLVTLSTVGFGEVIPLGHEGRVFTSFLILFNIGFFTYAISTVTSIFTDEGVRAFFLEFHMIEKVKKLNKHVIVCGFGRHASEVCLELTKQHTPFVVIESDPEKAELMRRETNYLFLEGDATDDTILEWAGIDRAAALVLTLPVDANNLFVIMTARQRNNSIKIISRSSQESDEMKLRRAGADHVVLPEKIGGFYMATLIHKPDLVEFFTLISNMGPSQIVFEEISVTQLKPEFQGKSIEDSGLVRIGMIPIVAIRYAMGNYQLNPDIKTILLPELHIVVLGDPSQINHFLSVVIGEKAVSRKFVS
ncbi:MAG: potassium channel protein [Saprospiraceae bacterium]|nr:potassium channel protein [Saprospiraceae bacterium]